jgi:hypothetical protein
MPDIIQLKITLKSIQPTIWRRVLVNWDFTFEELHLVIQCAMGWSNCHLYCFDFNGFRLSSSPEEDIDILNENEFEDASKVRLGSVLKMEKQKFRYDYDFGDGWIHEIEVEKFLPKENMVIYPVCIKGAMSCPPEDCGGVPGYTMLAAAMRNRSHPERKNFIAWLGHEFNPDEFNINKTNTLLSSLSE